MAYRIDPSRVGDGTQLIRHEREVTIVLVGCGGTGGVGSGATDIVPASAPIYIAVDTNLHSDQWKTVDADPTPFFGTTAHQSNIVDGLHQHFF